MSNTIQLKDGDCPACEGCGYVANDDDGTPWRAWFELPFKSWAAVTMGLVKPVECPACGGTGEAPKVNDEPVATKQGFYWGDVEVMRHRVDLDGSRMLFVRAPRSNLQVKISPAGLIETEINHRDAAPEDAPEVASDYAVTNVSIVADPKHPWREFEIKTLGRWWVSWWGQSGFNLRLPWWISGERDGEDDEGRVSSFCAAVLANSEDAARAVIANTTGTKIAEWRFVEPRPVDWSPFCDRFPRADWMQWPKEEER